MGAVRDDTAILARYPRFATAAAGTACVQPVTDCARVADRAGDLHAAAGGAAAVGRCASGRRFDPVYGRDLDHARAALTGTRLKIPVAHAGNYEIGFNYSASIAAASISASCSDLISSVTPSLRHSRTSSASAAAVSGLLRSQSGSSLMRKVAPLQCASIEGT